MKVVLASKNQHKLVEISKITEKFGFELVLQSQLGVDIDVEETGSTFEENSYIKAKAVMEATGLPALADDSGIAVDAQKRLAMHRSGRGAKYTRGRGPLALVYLEQCPSHCDALRRELAVKKLTREEKEHLISGQQNRENAMP